MTSDLSAQTDTPVLPADPQATSPSIGTQALLGAVLLVMGGMAIGYAPIGLRLSELGPQATAFWRYLLAVPVFFVLVLIVRRQLPSRPPVAVVIAGICFGLDMGLWHASLTYTSVANATFLVNLGNVGVGLLAWWLLKEKPTRVWAIAASVAILGATLLSLGGQGEGGVGDLRGDGLAFMAAFLVAGYMVYAKKARASIDALSAVFWMTLVEVGVAAILVLIMGEAFLPDTMSGFLVPLSLALIAQVGGQGLIIAGLGLTPTSIAGLLVLVQPVTAAALSYWMFGETLLPLQLVGAALILFGIALSQRKARRKIARQAA